MAAKKPTQEEVKALLVEALDARDEMAKLLFWDVKWSTVDECWHHCHRPGTGHAEALEIQKRIMRLGGGLPTDDWRDLFPELSKWYEEELKARLKRMAEMLIELDY
jgi:hypothetical protein